MYNKATHVWYRKYVDIVHGKTRKRKFAYICILDYTTLLCQYASTSF